MNGKFIERAILPGIAFVAAAGMLLQVQAQQGTPQPTVGAHATVTATPRAVMMSHEDPAIVKRGGSVFAESCASCHGNTAKGTNLAPDLIRSVLVEDDSNGNKLGPFLKTGHAKTKSDWDEKQVQELAAWLRVQVYGAAMRQTYAYPSNIVDGDAQKGEEFFQAHCASCHSATGDLAGIGRKYDAPGLQLRWLTGGGVHITRTASVFHNGASTLDTTPPQISKSTLTVTVTLANGEKLEGVPLSVTDFDVTFLDMKGQYHSIARENGLPKVVQHNPLQVHVDLLKTLKDSDMHNVTAYLVTLK